LAGQAMAQIQVFEPEELGFFRQNWDILQDSSGMLFFGNSDGIVHYNGTNWTTKHVPSGNAALSLIEYNDKIHWAGNGDFGVLEADSLSAFTPVSLKEHLDSIHHDFTLVWQMLEHNGNLYHKTTEGLLVWDGAKAHFIESASYVKWMFSFQGRLYLNMDLEDEGLAVLVDGDILPVSDTELLQGSSLYSTIEKEKGVLLVTRPHGLIWYDGDTLTVLETDGSDYLGDNDVYRGIAAGEDSMVFATLNGGILVTDMDGNMISVLSEKDGLPTNIVHDLALDHEKTLWAATDNGIAGIQLFNPLEVISEENGLSGIPLFCQIIGGEVLTGTTEGLFRISESGFAEPIADIEGRAFYGVDVSGFQIISTSSGLYKRIENGFELISGNTYIRLFPDVGETGGFYGMREQSIDYLKESENGLSVRTIYETEAVINDIHIDDGSLWIASGDRSVVNYQPESKDTSTFEIPISEDSNLYRISRVGGEIRLGTGEGLFFFEEPTQTFVRDTTFSDPELANDDVTRIEQCSSNEIWFRNKRQIKRAIRENGRWRTVTDPYRLVAISKEEGIEDIECGEDGAVWFAGTRDLYRLRDPDWVYSADFQTNITGVLAETDSLIFDGFGAQKSRPEFSYEENSLRFTYAAASYVEPEANQYRTRLRGYEEEWSSWSVETQKDYTFIPEGTYTFEVQGRNVYHKTGSIDSYTFIVLPPWYRTIWAYFFYLIMACGGIYGGYKIRLNSILKEQRIRDGIARDLHDELSSTLSSINFFADAIDSKKLQPNEANRFLSLIQKSSHEAKEKVSDIVWVIHSDNDDWENLLLRCKRFAADLLDSKQINYSFEVKGSFSGKPDISQRKNIWLIFREILTNIARHADPESVNIFFGIEGGKLNIRIEDDGTGFESEASVENGYGVKNIRDRAGQIKGSAFLESIAGEGTTWEIRIPYKF